MLSTASRVPRPPCAGKAEDPREAAARLRSPGPLARRLPEKPRWGPAALAAPCANLPWLLPAATPYSPFADLGRRKAWLPPSVFFCVPPKVSSQFPYFQLQVEVRPSHRRLSQATRGRHAVPGRRGPPAISGAGGLLHVRSQRWRCSRPQQPGKTAWYAHTPF